MDGICRIFAFSAERWITLWCPVRVPAQTGLLGIFWRTVKWQNIFNSTINNKLDGSWWEDLQELSDAVITCYLHPSHYLHRPILSVSCLLLHYQQHLYTSQNMTCYKLGPLHLVLIRIISAYARTFRALFAQSVVLLFAWYLQIRGEVLSMFPLPPSPLPPPHHFHHPSVLWPWMTLSISPFVTWCVVCVVCRLATFTTLRHLRFYLH